MENPVSTPAAVTTEPQDDNLPKMDFSDPIFNTHAKEVQKLIQTQNDLYQTSEKVVRGQLSVLHQRIIQKLESSKGLKSRLESIKNQRKLAKEDVDSFQPLTDKKLVAKYRLNEVKQKLESYDNGVVQTTHEISENLESIAETQFQIFNAINEHFKEIYKELKETQVHVLDLREQFRASTDILDRTEIRSPVTGSVTNLQYHTIGGVITHGSKILEIVPRSDKLIIEARLSPRDIASIHVGLTAKIQLSAYKSKLVPRIEGVVTHVSADRILNQQPSTSNNHELFYYLAKIEIKEGELDNLNYDVKLIPGMPADVFIVKGTRTMLQLLISPIVDSFYKAFKEA
jgi:HlyD family type I secretion membrane fusion protein